MITRNEKAKGLWWRLLATLPVLAFLMIANTKVTAQEKKAVDKPITIEMGQFEIYDDDGAPIQLNDTIIYGEDGSSIKFQASDSFDPITGEPCKKLTVTSYNADGTENSFFITETEKRGDTARYSIEPFSISGSLFEMLLDVATSKEDTVYQIVEQMPQYTGGEEAMMKYVAENIKYPQEAKDKNISGRVFIGFVIEKDGSIGEVKVLRGIGGGCDEEAVRVVKAMPKWKPGIKDGKPVRVSYMMPINFKLNDDQPAKTAKKSDVGKADMKPDKNGVYQIVEEMPRFPGDEKALMEYVAKNVVYPQEARDKEISGRVFVSFIVEKDGSVNEVEVKRGIGGGCDEEAVRVIKSMPKWKPGKQEGKPVRVSYMMPINFKLWDGKESKGSLANTKYEGLNTGTKDGVTYTMKMTMEFESNTTGYFVMALTSQKKNGKPQVEFEDVGLPFTYTFDGKSSGSIQPMNPDGSQLGETPAPPYGFIINKDGTILVNLFDMKDDIGVDKIVFKKVGNNKSNPHGWPVD